MIFNSSFMTFSLLSDFLRAAAEEAERPETVTSTRPTPAGAWDHEPPWSEDDVCRPSFTPFNVVVCLIFATIFCLSVFGNIVVIVTILYRRHRTIRSITNLFLLNLAIADLLRSVICMPVTLLGELTHCWLLGPVMCKLEAYLQPVGVCASAYTLAVIAVERYYAICRPLQSRKWHTKTRALTMITLVWVFSFACNIFSLFLFDALPYKDSWNCLTVKGPKIDFFYQIYVTLVLLFIPLSLMVGLYGNVIYTLNTAINSDPTGTPLETLIENSQDIGEKPSSIADWILQSVKFREKWGKPTNLYPDGSSLGVPSVTRTGSYSRRSSFGASSLFGFSTRQSFEGTFLLRSTNQEKILLAKRKVTRMLVTIVVIFALCWTPSYLYWLLVRTADVLGVNVWQDEINTVLTVLTYISSCTNPITYCFMNKSFRKSLVAFCRRRTCKKKRSLRDCQTPVDTLHSRSDGVHQLNNNINNNNNIPQIKVDLIDSLSRSVGAQRHSTTC